MSNESLSAVYQQTVRLYGQVASHALDAYYGVAQRTLNGVDARITSVLNSERLSIADGLKTRLGSAHRSVAGAIEGGVTKVRSNAQGLIDAAVQSTSTGIDAVVGLAGRIDAKFPQVSTVATPALQASLPAAKLTRDVAQFVANGVEKLADRLHVEAAPVAQATKAAKAAKATVRKTVRKAAATAKTATKTVARRARKAA